MIARIFKTALSARPDLSRDNLTARVEGQGLIERAGAVEHRGAPRNVVTTRTCQRRLRLRIGPLACQKGGNQ